MPRSKHTPPQIPAAPAHRSADRSASHSHTRRPHFPSTPWTVENFLAWVDWCEKEFRCEVVFTTSLEWGPSGRQLVSHMAAYRPGRSFEDAPLAMAPRMFMKPDDLYLVQQYSIQLFRLLRELDELVDDLSSPR